MTSCKFYFKAVDKNITVNSSDVKQKAKTVCETRILTDDDFRRINVYRLKKRLAYSGKRKNDDIKLDEELDEKMARYYCVYGKSC